MDHQKPNSSTPACSVYPTMAIHGQEMEKGRKRCHCPAEERLTSVYPTMAIFQQEIGDAVSESRVE